MKRNLKIIFIMSIGLICTILLFTFFYDLVKIKKSVLNESSVNIYMEAGYEQYFNTTINDLKIINEIEKNVGVNLFFSSTVTQEDVELFNSLNKGEYDAYYGNFSNSELNRLYKRDVIKDLKPYLKYMPNYLKFIEEHPQVKLANSDDNILYIPIVTLNPAFTTKLAIRDDWVDDQKDEINNFYDLAKVLDDLNNSYKKGELRNQGKYFIGLSGTNSNIKDFYKSFNAYDGLYIENNEIVLGAAKDEYREMLIYFNDLWEKGLLSQSQFGSDTVEFEKYVLTNQTAAFFANEFEIEKLQEYSFKNGDDIEFYIIDSFKDANGNVINYDYNFSPIQVHETGYVISSSVSDTKTIETLKAIDYFYSDECVKLLNTGDENLYFLKPELSVIDGDMQKDIY